jgi:hypothetical protein
VIAVLLNNNVTIFLKLYGLEVFVRMSELKLKNGEVVSYFVAVVWKEE